MVCGRRFGIIRYNCWCKNRCRTLVWEQRFNLGISRAVASAPALMCFRFIGTVLFLWISLFEQFWFGSVCLHLLVASGMRSQEQGLSPPVFAWGLPD